MQGARVFWDVTAGWTVETPFALSPRQTAAVVAWVQKIQGPRVLTMHGDKREQAAAALKSLTPATLNQSVIAKPNAERVLFEKR